MDSDGLIPHLAAPIAPNMLHVSTRSWHLVSERRQGIGFGSINLSLLERLFLDSPSPR